MIVLHKTIKQSFHGLIKIIVNAFRIFWSDVKGGIKNPLMMIILAGLVILPSLYAWVNILASTDPYSPEATGGIRFAVANMDEGGSLFDKEMDLGSQIVDNLNRKCKELRRCKEAAYYRLIK